ncbi:2-Keto-D-gluconate dehydrogenase membrane-bound cytochrome c [Candidatus Sodalis pierantonius str. SOPE]|uniref:2-Keto-D-gluconate dehydrogenase membrane-bound cytochrome c n=1 Tax=Candidatus Sodalis pierantonii str. SOPE TaxID=2342 RepID=W0HNP6_9GAMM|nr:cytochrome c [Candidatus Sodalis pierantonius]AHF73835.1 2-Keto-D-gluconate dehydrogenase membrane-bound cytochrome c [Candidatus Sodalis pierantonius str. SOPE]
MGNDGLRTRLLALLPVLLAVSGAQAQAPQPPAADLIARGRYLTLAGDCGACHTAPGAALDFGGGYPLATPVGVIYSTNISSDKIRGIGGWSDEAFVRAVREGVSQDGHLLYPAMPYDAYAKLKREDVLAIKAYLMSLPLAASSVPSTELSFPFNQRWGLAFWRWLHLARGELKDDRAQTPAWNRGRYLVEELAHCGTCHTPRTFTYGMDNAKAFGGGDLGSWVAFNITPERNAGIGTWNRTELASYLKSGCIKDKASAGGGMAEAIEQSLQYLTETDRLAIAEYIGSLAAVGDNRQTRPRDRWGTASSTVYALRAGRLSSVTGAGLYNSHCASCHGGEGEGNGDGEGFPSLFHHTTTGAYDSRNVVAVILTGVSCRGQNTTVMMPAFTEWLEDEQVVALSNFVSAQFGHPSAATITPARGKARREALRAPSPAAIEDGRLKETPNGS